MFFYTHWESGFERGGYDSGMSMTMEQVVTLLQQEVFTLKAQVVDQSGLADAVCAINNLATAQGKKDTPRLMDVKAPLVVRRNSLALRRIINSGWRRRRHSLQVSSRSPS